MKIEHSRAMCVREAVERVWTQTLGQACGRDNENFFVLGGDSLLGIIVIMAISEEFGLSLSLEDLYAYPTVEAFARHVASLLLD
jgi:acyl carrier protein